MTQALLSALRCTLLDIQVLQRARGVDDVEIELEDIVEAARQSRLIRNPYKSILQRKYRPQLVIACIFMIFQQFDVSSHTAASLRPATVLAAWSNPHRPDALCRLSMCTLGR